MEVAYNLNCPCQIVLTKGKEEIINVESLAFQENAHLSVCVSEVLIPRDYKTKEEWFKKVQEVWESVAASLEDREGEIEIIAPLPGSIYCLRVKNRCEYWFVCGWTNIR